MLKSSYRKKAANRFLYIYSQMFSLHLYLRLFESYFLYCIFLYASSCINKSIYNTPLKSYTCFMGFALPPCELPWGKRPFFSARTGKHILSEVSMKIQPNTAIHKSIYNTSLKSYTLFYGIFDVPLGWRGARGRFSRPARAKT